MARAWLAVALHGGPQRLAHCTGHLVSAAGNVACANAGKKLQWLTMPITRFNSDSASREIFRASGSTLQISRKLFNNQLVETRELYLTAIPDSAKVKSEFDTISFRFVENTSQKITDKDGNPIVGGVNSFPAPIHVVLFVGPEALSLLNQRTNAETVLITIVTATSILDWDRADALFIYESNILVGS